MQQINFFRFPFYILYGPNLNQISQGLEDVIVGKLNLYFSKNSKFPRVISPKVFTQGHPDLLILNPNSKTHSYTIDDLSPFFSFVPLATQDWPHRFVIVHQAQELGVHVHRLLKILEDPIPGRQQLNITIFFILPSIEHLPGTILGRAQKIQCLFSSPENKEINEEEKIMNFMIEGANSYAKMDQYIQLLKYLDKSKVYHVSNKERMILLSSFLES